MQSKPLIVVDDRETRAGVVDALLAREDCDVAVRRLVLADYLVAGRLLVERKTWPDFVASIVDGRLFRQACRLAASPQHSVILIEGREPDVGTYPVSREATLGALFSVSVVFGIPVLRSHTAEESANVMVCAGRQLDRLVSGAVPRPGFRPKSKRRIQLHLLQGLPGVGPTRAMRLLDRFVSVEAVVAAREEDLMQVAGIGPEVAHAIRWAVTESDQHSGRSVPREPH